MLIVEGYKEAKELVLDRLTNLHSKIITNNISKDNFIEEVRNLRIEIKVLFKLEGTLDEFNNLDSNKENLRDEIRGYTSLELLISISEKEYIKLFNASNSG